MYRVLVLLSTYNGEKFLSDQILSILNQKDVDISIIVRDDGSSDRTKEILKDFECNHSNIHVSLGENLGFVRSFTELVGMAVNNKTYDYYAFSDQDDVWHPDKLKTACKKLSESNKEFPCLYTSNSRLIDEDSNEIGVFHEQCPIYTRQNIMVYGTEQGCSMVFNRKALEMYNSNPPIRAWHDRWMLLICAYLGSYFYDHHTLFDYRIHSHNTLYKRERSFIKKLKDDIEYLLTLKRCVLNYEIAQEFFDLFHSNLKDEDVVLFRRYIGYRKSITHKILLLFYLKNPQQKLSLFRKLRSKIGIILNKL